MVLWVILYVKKATVVNNRQCLICYIQYVDIYTTMSCVRIYIGFNDKCPSIRLDCHPPLTQPDRLEHSQLCHTTTNLFAAL